MATREFAGIPVSGAFHAGYGHVEQYKLEDFLPLFNALVANKHVVSFGWHQYTPYFNDGEECVFGASTLWVKTDADKDMEEDDDFCSFDENYSVEWGDSILGEHTWDARTRVYSHQEPWVVELREAAMALNSAIEGGHFDNVLLENFGNHVEITVFPGEPSPRIETETYDHD